MTSSIATILPDTVDNCSFLNIARLTKIRDIVSACTDTLTTQKRKKDVLKKIQKCFTFERVFGTRGVQGITGILKVKNSPDKVVFKISVALDRSVEHENVVTSELNKLRPFCPHFVGNVGMINIPVSNDFVNDPDTESLFKNNNDYFPCNVLLIEYVSPISLYHVCKYLHPHRSLIISQLVQIMIALDIAQVKSKFTSYDLHLDNILVRQIEEDTLFLYIHKGKNILIPTYGLYPVIIDLGSSYVQAIEGKPMYTSSDNYHNGLQPTLFDNLNDIHHLLISVLYYLEDRSYAYDFLRTRFLYLFRHIPILSQKGWKQLPYDILDLVLRRIKEDIPDIKIYPVYKAYGDEIIEILNGLIILPWMDQGELNFNDCLPEFLEELQKIQDMKSVNSTDDILYILGETVDSINVHREEYQIDKKKAITNFAIDWKSRISFVISNNMKEIPKNLDFERLFSSAIKVAERMSANYYKYIEKHTNIISDAYIQTSITCPLDAAKILLQHSTPSFKVERNSKIYIWNSENESKTVITPNSLTDAQLESIDDTTILKKGDRLLEYLIVNGQLEK